MQANSVLRKIHQFIVNPVRMFESHNNYLGKDEPWSVILTAYYFVVQSSHHTMLRSTPSQLVLGRNMILYTPFISDWKAIRIHKQELIDKNNQN